MPARAARLANLVLTLVCALTIAAGVVGESNPYYLLGSAVEVALLAAVFMYARSWPASSQMSRPAAERLHAQ